jgi:hypothetical protein
MGTLKEHAIIITGYYGDHIDEAHAKATELFHADRFFPFSNGDQTLVTPIIESMVNKTRTFAIVPDGSKEGWDTSDEGDNARDEMVQWLRAQAYSDGSSPFSWVEVQYGDECGKRTRALRSSDTDQRRHKEKS